MWRDVKKSKIEIKVLRVNELVSFFQNQCEVHRSFYKAFYLSLSSSSWVKHNYNHFPIMENFKNIFLAQFQARGLNHIPQTSIAFRAYNLWSKCTIHIEKELKN